MTPIVQVARSLAEIEERLNIRRSGRVMYVDSGSSAKSDTANAGSQNRPFATVFGAAGAVANAVRFRGDRILVSNRHVEDMPGAVKLPDMLAICNVPGSVGARPAFTNTAIGQRVVINGCQILLSGCGWFSTVAGALTSFVTIDTEGMDGGYMGQGLVIDHCWFVTTSRVGLPYFSKALDLTVSGCNMNYSAVTNCLIYGKSNTAANQLMAIDMPDQAEGLLIANNRIDGYFATAGIQRAAGSDCIDERLIGNIINNRHTTPTILNGEAGGFGWVDQNMLKNGSTTGNGTVTAGSYILGTNW